MTTKKVPTASIKIKIEVACERCGEVSVTVSGFPAVDLTAKNITELIRQSGSWTMIEGAPWHTKCVMELLGVSPVSTGKPPPKGPIDNGIAYGEPGHSCAGCGVNHDTCPECGTTHGDSHERNCRWVRGG